MDATRAAQQRRREAETPKARVACLHQDRSAQQLRREAETPDTSTTKQISPTAKKGSRDS